jgi:hypothetical protein
MTLARAVKVQLVTTHVDETPGMGELSSLERCRDALVGRAGEHEEDRAHDAEVERPAKP